MRRQCPCNDCGKPTTPDLDYANYDWYVVRNDVWEAAGMSGYWSGWLCTPCLEARLGRQLKDEDYLMRTVGLTRDGNLDLWFDPDYDEWLGTF